jgi:hypothetical protein
MPKRARRIGSDATAVLGPSKAVSSETARMMPERSTLGESVKAEAAVSPTENEIARAAYQLWVNNGCPAGSDREDWYRAEAMLKDALVAKCEGPPGVTSIPRDARTESQVLVAFRWGMHGHWEVWQSEWGGARWIWDDATPGPGFSNRAS